VKEKTVRGKVDEDTGTIFTIGGIIKVIVQPIVNCGLVQNARVVLSLNFREDESNCKIIYPIIFVASSPTFIVTFVSENKIPLLYT
jgi:hypothetical protein